MFVWSKPFLSVAREVAIQRQSVPNHLHKIISLLFTYRPHGPPGLRRGYQYHRPLLSQRASQQALRSSPTDCLVLCGSAILYCAETVFSTIHSRPDLAKTLVICGGIGHSTQYLYGAIASSAKYSGLFPEIQSLPEARVLNLIFKRYYDGGTLADSGGCKVIIEDKSTNCGANAIETRKVLEANGLPTPRSFIIVQDPTMSIRTLAAFKKTYEDASPLPEFTTCPTFVPKVRLIDERLEYAISGVDTAGLWEMDRFCDLVVGEIPRLRDDAQGYGPRGRGFIDHVDMPGEVEEAWKRLTGSWLMDAPQAGSPTDV